MSFFRYQILSVGSVNATANAGHIMIEGSQVIATEDIHLNADRVSCPIVRNTARTCASKFAGAQALGLRVNAQARPEANKRVKQNQISHAKLNILLNIKAK
jgi:hypothetical protein